MFLPRRGPSENRSSLFASVEHSALYGAPTWAPPSSLPVLQTLGTSAPWPPLKGERPSGAPRHTARGLVAPTPHIDRSTLGRRDAGPWG